MTSRIFALCLVSIAVVIGCETSQTHDRRSQPPDRLYVYSIDFRYVATDGEKSDSERFHGFLVLGKTEVKAQERRDDIMHAINKGIKESDGSAAKCFDPRHGVRAFRGDTKTDYVICFECLQVDIFDANGKKRKTTTQYAKDVLNELLKSAGIDVLPENAPLLDGF